MFLNNGETMYFNDPMSDLSGVTYTVSDLAFYISNLRIGHDGGQILDFGDSVFYVNMRASIFELGMQDVDQVESIAFQVGVPQHLNHTDISAYPEDHPLYFQSPPMHWGWTAGYTFFLIHGEADNNNDNAVDVPFELHCLGDENLQEVEVITKATIHNDGTREIFQPVNVEQWIRNIDLKSLGAQHGSIGINADAMTNIQNYPVFTAPLNAGIDVLTEKIGTVRFSGTNDQLTIFWESMVKIDKLELYNVEGKKVASVRETNVNGEHVFSGLTSGMYILKIKSNNGDLLNQINVVQP